MVAKKTNTRRPAASGNRRASREGSGLSLWIYLHWQQLMTTMREIWGTPLTSLMTIGVIGVSLALPATLMIILKNVEQVSSQWQTGTQITLYLEKGLDDSAIQQYQDKLKQNPQIESLHYISPDDGMKQLKSLSGFSDAQSYLTENPLPPVLEVVPRAAYRTPQSSEALLRSLKQDSEVQQAKLDLQWVSRLNGIVSLVRTLAHVFGAFLVVALLLTVANTLRLYISNRRQEIEVLKLVGATDSFIQRPFLYLGFWYGVVGGLVAWWLSEVLILFCEEGVSYVADLYDSDFHLTGLGTSDGGILLLLGISLSMGAAWFSVHRHIREIEP